ncbi:MAG: hypothetical protein R2726_00805 [Acidimicrobiales bacterium]
MRRTGALVILALVATVLPALLPAVTEPAAAVPTAAAQTTNTDCTGTPTPDLPLLLPAWADAAGWANADQFQTIMMGDLDGDGGDELLGRNASTLEVQRWATPFQAAAIGNPDRVAPLPVPGQWVPDGVLGPSIPEINGFYDPSTYSTIQMANLDGVPGQEVLIRSTNGLQIFKYVKPSPGTPASWQTINTSVWADSYSVQWWQPQYYETITTGDVDGDGADEIVGRGPAGIQTFKLVNGQLQQLDAASPPVMADSAGWDQPQYYDTIRLADVTGPGGTPDGKAELIGRAPGSSTGMVVLSLGSNGVWSEYTNNVAVWPDSQGQWKTNPSWYTTIGTADLNGDGFADVYGRTQYGLDAWTFAGGTWSELASPAPSSSSPTILTDAQGFDQAPYYATIQAAVLGAVPGSPAPAGRILARYPANVLAAPNQAGGVAFSSFAGSGFAAPALVAGQFTDANGWNQAVRYQTLRTGNLADGTDLLVGKDATGMRTYRLDGGTAGGSWAYPSATFPAWSSYTKVQTPGSSAPPDPDPTMPPGYPVALWDQQLASYKYINDQVGSTYSTELTVRQLLSQATASNPPVTLQALAAYIGGLAKTPPTGQNVNRDVWNATLAQVQGWALEASYLWGFYFDSQASMQLLIAQTQTVADQGPNSPNDVAGHFEKNMAIDALIGDLIWGIVGGITTGDPEAARFLTAFTSMLGAGVSGGLGFLNPNGKVSTNAQNLNDELVSSFCGANNFLYSSFAQTVADAGLLDAMGRMTEEGPLVFAPATNPPNPAQFSEVEAASSDQRAIWVWQQFANQNKDGWRVGYCWGNTTCNLGFISRVDDGYGEFYGVPGSYSPEPWGGYYYRVLSTLGTTANCEGTSHGGDGGWKTLMDAGVGFDTNTLFMPRTQANQGAEPPAADVLAEGLRAACSDHADRRTEREQLGDGHPGMEGRQCQLQHLITAGGDRLGRGPRSWWRSARSWHSSRRVRRWPRPSSNPWASP